MTPESEGVRVHSYLAKLGLASRRSIEVWIKEGRVRVNGKIAKLGQKINPGSDEIAVNGKKVFSSNPDTKKRALVLNKPRGFVTTVKDPEGRPTIMDLIPSEHRLFPVGRLDLQSEGLVLLTNDGELANRIMHPRYEIPKVYEVKIRGNLDQKKLDHLKAGVNTAEGKFKGAEILSMRDVTQEGVKKFQVTLKVFEGKNRHVRKMFDAVKCRVIRLKRVAIGPIGIKGIPKAGFRILSTGEIQKLRRAVGL